MADIYNAKTSETEIHNGSVVVSAGGRGSLTKVINVLPDGRLLTPTIATISGKYDSRWTGIRYYTGDADS